MTTRDPRSPVLEEAVGHLQPISLAEIDQIAALQIRRDRKYLLAPERLGSLLAGVEADVRVLEVDGARTAPYRSTYFDTPELVSYLSATRSRPRRMKVRTRTYPASGTSWLEVKLRTGRGDTHKERVPHPLDAEQVLTAEARRFLGGYPEVRDHLDDLSPRMVTAYTRLTLECGQRVTVDAHLRCARPGGDAIDLGELADLLVVETKSPARGPGPIDRALWRLGVRPVSISKYAVGTAAGDPALAANKWHRVLSRHVHRTRTGGPR